MQKGKNSFGRRQGREQAATFPGIFEHLTQYQGARKTALQKSAHFGQFNLALFRTDVDAVRPERTDIIRICKLK